MSMVLKESLKYILRSRPMIKREIRHVEWLYSLSEDEIYNYKERQFLRVFRKAYRHSSFYRDLYRKHGIAEDDIKCLSDISALPVVTKDMIKRHGKEMLTVPRFLVFSSGTSGTSGTPLTVYHSYKALRLEQAYIFCRRKNAGFIYGKDRQVSLRGNLGASKYRAYSPLSRTLYLSSFLISDETADDYYNAISRFNPVCIEGYPSSLYNLALSLERRNLRLSVPKVFTSSEKLFPFQRDLIESVFGAQLFDRYGCTERSVSFSENLDHQGYYEDPGYCYTEFFNDHIVTTSLINNAFPLIRYRVGDVLTKGGGGVVETIEGRSEDVVVCKDGKRIGRLDHILKGVSGISIAQIIQKDKGKIEIRYVPEFGFSDSTIGQIEHRLYSKIAMSNMDVVFVRVREDEIIYTSRNKFSFVKSYLDLCS